MRVAFASGKGGTGKTLLSTAFARALADREPGRVAYVDADVEEPNGHLFLHPEKVTTTRFSVPIPVLVDGRCRGCGACQRFCAWHAIIALRNRVMVLPELCHACGGCIQICPDRALREQMRSIGSLSFGTTGGLAWHSGRLDVGEARSTPLVSAVLESAPEGALTVVDCPPGTSCPVLAALEGADRVVLVTEPTPFGLHDLDLAIRLCRVLGLPHVAVLNRADLGDGGVRDHLAENDVPLVAEIPFEREIAVAVSEGRIPLADSPALKEAVERLIELLESPGGPS
ncbi:MAG: ATP-binding protein [Deltaproteobacteria bacterium]|nr:ATP-binding protein [Deltaproteobacteria bacterium]